MQSKKNKILNDPVYGFVNLSSGISFDIIEHPYFQRLRRIRQLGLTYLVYPGAIHNRFQHAIGAAHLMQNAIEVIRSKGHEITDEEAEAVMIAILLHDIGHGPFSHALENSIVHDITHEDISLIIMSELNQQFNGALSLAIKIFQDTYHKRFLHQLVSSQLDMDRLDYLQRDSFFTGVSEGVIGSERIIKMLDVVNDNLVVEAKGIYSIENYLIARRLMYWQVYLHKTVLSSEQLLVKILKRAKQLALKGNILFATPALSYFLYNKVTKESFLSKPNSIHYFAKLDDYDILASIKAWADHDDFILSDLCNRLTNRNLFRIELQEKPFDKEKINTLKSKVIAEFKIPAKDAEFFVFSDSIINSAYSSKDENINILYNTGKLTDIALASDMLNTSVLSKKVKKYFLCYPKQFRN